MSVFVLETWDGNEWLLEVGCVEHGLLLMNELKVLQVRIWRLCLLDILAHLINN